MKRHLVLLALIAGGVFVLDQWTKAWATATLQHRPPVEQLVQPPGPRLLHLQARFRTHPTSA